MENTRQRQRLRKGGYMGDVSALCLIPRYTPHQPFPLLLAGTGAQILLYDMNTLQLLATSQVFDGVRVHGIEVHNILEGSEPNQLQQTKSTTLAVHGEKRVKLLEIVMIEGNSEGVERDFQINIVHVLPRLKHWIMDVRFIKKNNTLGRGEDSWLLAIGLSDNSVVFWDMTKSEFIGHVACAERCLLYSLRLWGESASTLLVAAGTIFNEVLVWKINGQSIMGSDKESESSLLGRLKGHEGSIFRIKWCSTGKQLVSVSDDRSARIWNFSNNDICADATQGLASKAELQMGPVFYGHSARIWDCHLDSEFLITVSEDCTIRTWALDGQNLGVVKAHKGRGIWRCAFDSKSAILITAGADALIKMHSLRKYFLDSETLWNKVAIKGNPVLCEEDQISEVFEITPKLSSLMDHENLLSSKSEYVRCLHLVGPTCLYIATNQGFLLHVRLAAGGMDAWTSLYCGDDFSPIVCMDVLSEKKHHCKPDCANEPNGFVDWIALGDGKGRAVVLRVQLKGDMQESKCIFSWPAEEERQLLGIHWCENLGSRYVFTTDPSGGLSMWQLKQGGREGYVSNGQIPGMPPENGSQWIENITLLNRYKSNFHARIVCLDALCSEEVLFCGDKKGNIVVFPLQLFSSGSPEPCVIPNMADFKGAHGISSVASIKATKATKGKEVQIFSTGRDGCICQFAYYKPNHTERESLASLTCLQVESLDAIKVVESLMFRKPLSKEAGNRRIAAGFTADQFLFWDLQDDSELARFVCGGWKRPFSFYLGDLPEIQHCFVYVKAGLIHVIRKWVMLSSSTLKTPLLMPNVRKHLSSLPFRPQFHGKELHTVEFISKTWQKIGHCIEDNYSVSWIATGSEDGSVRLTRYNSNPTNIFDLSLVLGEHVGGSAVRIITVVSKPRLLSLFGFLHCDFNTELEQWPLVLLSAGAKEVMTCWSLEWTKEENEQVSNLDVYEKNGQLSLSSQWLSTTMQQGRRKCEKYSKGDPHKKSGNEMHTKAHECEDDLRYLSMTAFSVLCQLTRSLIIFTVTGSSNARLSVRAFHLSSRTWFEVALLIHHKTPVLALHHLIIPASEPDGSSLDMFLIFSGSTDGAVVVWDLTELVNTFTWKYSHGNLDGLSLQTRRPPSGRGSQGGSRWKSWDRRRTNAKPNKNMQSGDQELTMKRTDNSATDPLLEECSEENMHPGDQELTMMGMEKSKEIQPTSGSNCSIQNVYPLHVIPLAHQSGVNCLYVGEFSHRDLKMSGEGSPMWAIVSGGDDQALHFTLFTIVNESRPQLGNSENLDLKAGINPTELDVNAFSVSSQLMFVSLNMEVLSSAHSSSVKSIWTDGTLVFSSGLDQRLRAWCFVPSSNTFALSECCHCVIDVPEPSSLDVQISERGDYRIAVGGRGLQIVEMPSNKLWMQSM